MSGQAQEAQKAAGDTAEKTKQVGSDKLGDAQKTGQGVGQTVQDKAGAAKDQTGSVFSQAGDKASETFNNVKSSLTGK